jgi:hypothetical protein
MFDSKSDAFLFNTVGGSQTTPALHITKPLLHEANFRSTFAIEGFYAYSALCKEPFTGTYSASEENGVTIDVHFANPKMQEFAQQAKSRPVVYWHSDDDDGGLEYEVNVKFMTAAVGGR